MEKTADGGCRLENISAQDAGKLLHTCTINHIKGEI
jgi:hypothetical protein